MCTWFNLIRSWRGAKVLSFAEGALVFNATSVIVSWFNWRAVKKHVSQAGTAQVLSPSAGHKWNFCYLITLCDFQFKNSIKYLFFFFCLIISLVYIGHYITFLYLSDTFHQYKAFELLRIYINVFKNQSKTED